MTQLMEQIKEKDAQAFTHSGKFHADDVFSSALLLSVNPEITIHRGSQVPEDFKGIVFDIGRGKYDHHQRDSRIRENGVPYAAFGLLWEELGAEILGEELAEKFDEAFVQPLDNNDNTGEKNELATLIGNFNPPWDAQGVNDAAFFNCLAAGPHHAGGCRDELCAGLCGHGHPHHGPERTHHQQGPLSGGGERPLRPDRPAGRG